MTHGQSSVELPPTLFNQTTDSITVVGVFFNTLDQVLTNTDATTAFGGSLTNDSKWSFDSRLASITMRPHPPKIIAPPFILVLEKLKVMEHLFMKNDNPKVMKRLIGGVR